jgi:hypothetical protein
MPFIGTLIYNIDRPLVEFHINELIKSMMVKKYTLFIIGTRLVMMN